VCDESALGINTAHKCKNWTTKAEIGDLITPFGKYRIIQTCITSLVELPVWRVQDSANTQGWGWVIFTRCRTQTAFTGVTHLMDCGEFKMLPTSRNGDGSAFKVYLQVVANGYNCLASTSPARSRDIQRTGALFIAQMPIDTSEAKDVGCVLNQSKCGKHTQLSLSRYACAWQRDNNNHDAKSKVLPAYGLCSC